MGLENLQGASRGSPRGLGVLESRLMEALWASSDPLSVQDIREMLGSVDNYKTVMTVLNRLVEKDLLVRNLDGRAYRYRPTQDRESFVESSAQELIRGFADAYGPGAVDRLARIAGTLTQPSASTDHAARGGPTFSREMLNRSHMPSLGTSFLALGILEAAVLFLTRTKNRRK